MSRWSTEPLRIALVPGELALVRGRDHRVLAAASDPLSLLPLLDQALADPAWRGRRAEVVLSQRLVRLVLTPPPGKALARAEEHALVAASLRDIYGDTVDQWQLAVVSQPPHCGLAGAAVVAAFVRQLDALLARHGFRDIAIRPLASLAARRLPSKFQGWWALAEPDWISLFGMADGCWLHLAAQPVDAGWAAALPELIAREAALATLPRPCPVWVQPVGVGTVARPAAADGQWQVLPHDAQTRGALALARL